MIKKNKRKKSQRTNAWIITAIIAVIFSITGYLSGFTSSFISFNETHNNKHQSSGDLIDSVDSIDSINQTNSVNSIPLPYSDHSTHDSPIHNFTEAKKAARIIFRDQRHTFYCGCSFDKHQHIDLGSCGYQIQGDIRRAGRVEWEHIVPVSHLASHLPCWQKPLCCKKNGKCYKGRECCRQIDPEFSKMEGDLHNLVPEIGELNALRSNYRFGMLPSTKAGQFGECKIKIDPDERRVEPRPEIRGQIARTYFYMAERYHMTLSDSQIQLFNAWNKQYPPEEWEIEWDRRIQAIQGNSNHYISRYILQHRKN